MSEEKKDVFRTENDGVFKPSDPPTYEELKGDDIGPYIYMDDKMLGLLQSMDKMTCADGEICTIQVIRMREKALGIKEAIDQGVMTKEDAIEKGLLSPSK